MAVHSLVCAQDKPGGRWGRGRGAGEEARNCPSRRVLLSGRSIVAGSQTYQMRTVKSGTLKSSGPIQKGMVTPKMASIGCEYSAAMPTVYRNW